MSSSPFHRVLVANRGEIAVRIIRACRELGIETVVAHSEADRDSLAVHLADDSVCVGPAASAKSYLNIPNIISAALISGADAVHPGYGLLSEHMYFAEICEKCQLAFIGPHPEVIGLMGDKAAARAEMARAGLPIVPGTEPLRNVEEAQEAAAEIGYPVMIKAAAGGGGRGMRMAATEAELLETFGMAQLEAQSAFGSGQLYLERYLQRCRHIEVQILGDHHGHVIGLGERNCSVQRRNQKLLEEAPSPALDEDLRRALIDAAVRGAQAIGYSSAGTMEFLVDDAEPGRFYFLEMNTRIQVEHGITELVTGVDLVKAQFRIAADQPLGISQDQVRVRGHALECRVTSEDAAAGFRPQFGTVGAYLPPGGPGVRVDSHLYSGYSVPIHYDSVLSKVMNWGTDREEALDRMRRALREYRLDGVTTTIPFHLQILDHPRLIAGDYDLAFLRHLESTA
ncbi:MAG: acetyl-CoA carboxylase biotin carboxylase subunit [Chloroflexota bacterium]